MKVNSSGRTAWDVLVLQGVEVVRSLICRCSRICQGTRRHIPEGSALSTPNVGGVRAELHLLQISAESSPTDVTVFVVLYSACRQIAGYATSGSAAPTSANFQPTVYQSVI